MAIFKDPDLVVYLYWKKPYLITLLTVGCQQTTVLLIGPEKSVHIRDWFRPKRDLELKLITMTSYDVTDWKIADF